MIWLLAALAAAPVAPAQKERQMSFFDLKTNNLDGTPADLSQYKGKVVLVVNTASECGYTPQYEGLEKLHQELSGKGFEILGFPSNDFGGQEPGTPQEIRKFCTLKYNVTFPLFEKVKTKGEGQSPVYAFLTSKHGEPQWNFYKYLVGKDGQVRQMYKNRTKPEDKDLRAAIDAALKE
jgi:glutathione peroxidase